LILRNLSGIALSQDCTSAAGPHPGSRIAGAMGRIIALSAARFLEQHQQYPFPITMVDIVRDALLAFARLHVLHHASEEPIFGVGMMDELKRHGYAIGPGTLYPLLHRLEADGLLTSRAAVVNGKARKYYQITRAGRNVLRTIAPKIAELCEEIVVHPRRTAVPAGPIPTTSAQKCQAPRRVLVPRGNR
jgi:PadR family transcriptional regulator, regulatory protein PadR